MQLSAVWWYDNRAVTSLSSLASVQEVTTAGRCDRATHVDKQMHSPNIVTTYNRHTRGVDFYTLFLVCTGAEFKEMMVSQNISPVMGQMVLTAVFTFIVDHWALTVCTFWARKVHLIPCLSAAVKATRRAQLLTDFMLCAIWAKVQLGLFTPQHSKRQTTTRRQSDGIHLNTLLKCYKWVQRVWKVKLTAKKT